MTRATNRSTARPTARDAYATIVADPPWEHARGGPRTTGSGKPWSSDARAGLPYVAMPLDAIKAIPAASLAARHAHLYLWTTNAFLRAAYEVVEAWGFKFSTLLTWCKPPMGLGPGGAYAVTTEFVLFARRGSLKPLRRWDSTWFELKRPHRGPGGPIHSAKPEGFQDIVEQVSPGPYLELFARRKRLGWDVWGNEVDSDVEVAA